MKNVLRGILVSLLLAFGIDDLAKGQVWLGIAGIVLAALLGIVYWAETKQPEK